MQFEQRLLHLAFHRYLGAKYLAILLCTAKYFRSRTLCRASQRQSAGARVTLLSPSAIRALLTPRDNIARAGWRTQAIWGNQVHASRCCRKMAWSYAQRCLDPAAGYESRVTNPLDGCLVVVWRCARVCLVQYNIPQGYYARSNVGRKSGQRISQINLGCSADSVARAARMHQRCIALLLRWSSYSMEE
ncbi:hypothetical protein BDV96DRAFT_121835 [Lophiotrema nucula]|uniref:Uncharacterized protein n=1 Tax=Lophiotrema nucula TaxID=690887 RepID=A0A6A5Z1P3_9PLEO|nr:hypothetical protein BDV96DRAFT_121835 [Lophiotrema nucula]